MYFNREEPPSGSVNKPLLLLLLLFCFFLIIQSQAAFVNCLCVARLTIVHSKTQIKLPLNYYYYYHFYCHYNNLNLWLITKLTIKSYLHLISLKKLFSQSTIYIIPFDLKKKWQLISIKKIHSIKNISYIQKKIQLKNGSFQLN